MLRTREAKVKAIIDSTLYAHEATGQSLMDLLVHVLTNGFDGYRNRADEEIDELYRVCEDYREKD